MKDYAKPKEKEGFTITWLEAIGLILVWGVLVASVFFN